MNELNLSDEDKRLLQLLGLTVEEPKKRTTKPVLQEYTERISTTCQTCGEVSVHYFSMQWSDRLGGLVSYNVPGPEFDKKSEHKTKLCGKCHDNLLMLSKEELVTLLIECKKKGG